MIVFLITLLSLAMSLIIMNEFYYWVVLYDTQEHHIMRGRNKTNLEWISFGSSYCRFGILPEEPGKGFNFGVAAQFFYYSDKMLREYTPRCLKKGGTVYLIIADLVFAEVGKYMYGADRYQELLNRKSLGDEFSVRKKLRLRFPLLINPLLTRRILAYLLKGRRNDFSTLDQNPITLVQAHKEAEKRCSDWCEQFGLIDTRSTKISPKLEQKFEKTRNILTGMIEFCLENGYKPVLVVTPVSEVMREHLGKEFLQRVLFDNIDLANLQNVPFRNFIDDPEFADFSLYHKNADMLNARGRKMFTNKLLAL